MRAHPILRSQSRSRSRTQLAWPAAPLVLFPVEWDPSMDTDAPQDEAVSALERGLTEPLTPSQQEVRLDGFRLANGRGRVGA